MVDIADIIKEALVRNNIALVKTQALDPPAIPLRERYGIYASGLPIYQPWFHDSDLDELGGRLAAANSQTLVTRDRLYSLKQLLLQSQSSSCEVWECGVYQGGTAALIQMVLHSEKYRNYRTPSMLRLFDTFQGLPQPQQDKDIHVAGEFSDTSLQKVQSLVGQGPLIDYRPGLIPASFAGLEQSTIRFAHIDVDLYQSILDCCDFIFPRLIPGGVMLFDDYGFPSCPGAREAVDVWASRNGVYPLALPTGQAVIFRGVF